MGGADSFWQETQAVLGPLLPDGPQLTEKYLKKPPFRFVHDIFTGLTRTHGLGEGLLAPDELDAKAFSDKSQKVAVLTKIIDFVGAVHRQRIDVEAKHIVSGKEPEKTNAFLQMLGKAVKADKADWAHGLRACGIEPEGSAAAAERRDKKEKTISCLSVDTAAAGPDKAREQQTRQEPTGEWKAVLEQVEAFRAKVQEAARIDVAECKKKRPGMGGEIRAVQEELQALVKHGVPPTDILGESLTDPDREDEEELSAQIGQLRERIRETCELTMENEQVIERIMTATGLA
eukprot:TRINITY_DN71056_c0_g1_i1.p1 TRINITY_DN71056_c0_g1~~TRINITY_DN71056_c0_g1_i1.p1  ORF type:complete len:289 (+),score=112.85 TRINITY_DN71056_c0_g1_i1:81-947(+)